MFIGMLQCTYEMVLMQMVHLHDGANGARMVYLHGAFAMHNGAFARANGANGAYA